jgi:hypothetical protein
LVVRIDEDFEFTGKLIDRGKLMGAGESFSEHACRMLTATVTDEQIARGRSGVSICMLGGILLWDLRPIRSESGPCSLLVKATASTALQSQCLSNSKA